MTKEEFEKNLEIVEGDPERRKLLRKLCNTLESLSPEELKKAMSYMEEQILTYTSKSWM